MFKLKNHRPIKWKKLIITGIFILGLCFSYCFWWSREWTPLNVLSQWTDKVEKIKINKYKLRIFSALQTDLYNDTLKTIQYKDVSPAFESLDEIVLELNSKGSDCSLNKQDVINILYYTNKNFKNNLHSLSDNFTAPSKTNMKASCEKLLSWCIMSAEEREKNKTPDYISYCKSIVDYQFVSKSLNKEQLLSVSENNKWSDMYRNNSLQDSSYDILNDVYVLSQIFFDAPAKPDDVLFYSMPGTRSSSNWQNNNWNNWWSGNWLWWWEWWNDPIEIPFEPYHTPQEEDPEDDPECNQEYNGQIVSNLTAQEQLCTKWVFSSFAFNNTTNQWTWSCRNTIWRSVECIADKEIVWLDIPTVGDDMWNLVDWVNYRNEWSLDSFLWNDCVPWFDDTQYQIPEDGFCGDGTVNNWEYCDPNDETEFHWWNWWCSSSCEAIVIDEPVCNDEYNRQRSSNLTQDSPLCTIWIIDSFAYNDHKRTWTCKNTLWSRVNCESTEKYCGDWMLDEWETCDPNDMRHRNRWNVWCSAGCEAITEDDPECNAAYNWHTVNNLTSQSQLCTKWTSLWFSYNESNKRWTWRCENVLWNSVQCAADKEESSWGTSNGDWSGNISSETRLCLNKCTEIRDAKKYSDAVTCYAKCFCQSVEWPTDREWLERNASWWLLTYLDSTIWLWPIFKLEFCIQPVASHKLETAKKANSLEVVMTEINNVLQDLRNSGQLLKHKRTKEYMEAGYSLNGFWFLSFSIHSTTKKPAKSKTEKTEKDTQEELNKTLETNILWFSEHDGDKYIIKWSTQTEPIYEVNISEINRALDINRLAGMDSEFTDFLQTNVDFWLSVHEALQDMRETVNALSKKK